MPIPRLEQTDLIVAATVLAAGTAAVLSEQPAPALASALACAGAVLARLMPRALAPTVAPEAFVPDPDDVSTPDDRAQTLAREIRQMSTLLEREVVQAIGDIVDRAEHMKELARGLRDTAGDMRASSAATSHAVDSISGDVAVAADAARKLTGSLGEVQSEVTRTSAMCHSAAEQAQMANQTVQSLSEAALHIGQVIGTIHHIARQTNMLALNATIEAARAGEWGRGFAVVANEVKALATTTAQSTEDIASQVEGIRQAVQQSAAAIEKTVTTISDLDGVAAAMAETVSSHLAMLETIVSRTDDASTSVGRAGSTLSEALSVNDRASDMAELVDNEVEAVAERVQGFQKMTALVVKRALRVAGTDPEASGQPRGIDFIVHNRRIKPLAVEMAADGARIQVADAIDPGTPVEVEIPEIGRLSATAEQCEGNVAVLSFQTTQIVRDRLTRWLAAGGMPPLAVE